VAATLPVIAWGGGEGLLAMLRYQGDRGLEVESVAAYPFMLSWSLGHHVAPAFGHETMEFAVAGLVATVVSVALPLALVVLTGLIWRDNAARVTMTWAVSLIALVVLLTSKMMSPQYLIWILALTAVAVDEDRGLTTGARSRLVLTVTVTALLTQWIYPLHWVKVALAGGTEVMVVFTLRLAVLGLLTFLVARHTFARRADSDLLGADQAPAVESLGEYRGRLVVQQG
jgi:hypothetical protein